MRVFDVKADDVEAARSQLAEQLGVQEDDLKFVKENRNKFSFEALSCPPVLELDISHDKMRCRIKRVQLPIGKDAPKLTSSYAINYLKKKGIKHGIQVETITEELFKVTSNKNFNEKKVLNILAAEGTPPVAAQAGRPQWILDLKVFKKDKPVWCKKGEVLAKAPLAVKGQEGTNVYGEKVAFDVEDQFKLTVGKGILTKAKDDETIYYTESAGQLFFDQGIRLRLVSEVLDRDEGLRAAILIGKQSFNKKAITGKDLVETAKKQGVNFGLLSPEQVQKEIDSTKKWPAEITVAKGKGPVDGKAGSVSYPYKKPKSDRPVDQERAKSGVVFKGEVVAIINPPSEPKNGMTVFGEELRGRSYTELPIYPGKNIAKEKRDDGKDYLIAQIYGRVKINEDRISVENMIQVAKDGSKATLEVFPQELIDFEQLGILFRDKDVLAGYNQEKLASHLEQIHKSGKKEDSLVVAEAQPVREGKNAKLRYYFRPDDLKEKGVLVKSKPKQYFAAPGDLLLEKFVPIDAEPGYNVYREVLEVPKQAKASDVDIDSGKNIIEKEVGTYGDENDPARIQYRAATFGYLKWKKPKIDLDPLIEVGEKEEYVRLKLAPKSDFGSKISYQMIEKLAEEEAIRVELNKDQIEKMLRTPLSEEGELHEVEIATSKPAVHGEDSKLEYYVELNGVNVGELLDGDSKKDLEPIFADCVRPKEVVATKTAAGVGEDGMTVFGRRIIADRGADEPWLSGYGLDRSEDGKSLIVTTKHPGYIVIDDRRLTVLEPVEIAPDRMSATLKIFPSKNSRFQPSESKLMEMIEGAGVKAGIKKEAVSNGLRECMEKQEPVEVVIAEGVPAKTGREARHRFVIEIEQSAGKLREDGSIDYKAGGVFQMVKSGQLLMVKEEPTRGEDGFNVLGEKLNGQLGADQHVEAGPGVKVSDSGLEYVAQKDGIVEFTGRMIRVIEGLLIEGDVDYSTGNIEAGNAQVMVRGSVLTDFSVKTESDISIDNVAESCSLTAGANIRVRGGIIGKEKGLIKAKGNIESLYINSSATVEADGDVIPENECLNSHIRTGGELVCKGEPGTVSGGEIWAFRGVKASNLGSPGSESPTIINLGVNYMEYQQALKRIEEEEIPAKEAEILKELKALDKELHEIYDQIPIKSKEDPEEAASLQELYREQYEIRKGVAANLDTVRKQKEAILNTVKTNKEFKVTVTGVVHPGTIFKHQKVEWVVKEPMRGVEIIWNSATSNFMSRRI